MCRLEEWPSSTEFGLQAACNVVPVLRKGGPGPSVFWAQIVPGSPLLLFAGEVEDAEQPPIRGEVVDAQEKLLKAGEALCPFGFGHLLRAFSPGFMPSHRNFGGASRRVLCTDDAEARVLEKPLVFRGRAEEVVADGAARRDLLLRDHAADDERIAKEQAASGLEDAVDSGEERGPARNVAERVIREDGVKVAFGKRQGPGGIADLETHQRLEILLGGELIRIADAVGVDVEAEDAAADFLGQAQGVSPRAATDLEDGGIGREIEQTGDGIRFSRSDPAGLAEVFAIGLDAGLAVGIELVVGVGAGVEIDFFGHVPTHLSERP